MSKPTVFAELRRKLVERHGDDGLHQAFCAVRDAADVEHARALLAQLSARIADSNFDTLVANGVTVADFVKALSDDAVPPQRRIIVDAAWAMLVGAATAESLAPGEAAPNPAEIEIAAAVLLDRFDASRLEAVRLGMTTEADATAAFAAAFSRPDAPVTPAEFLSYCGGISEQTANEKDFQLAIVRMWNLDRRGVRAPSAAGSPTGGSLAASMTATQSLGRAHPLYQTSSMQVGRGAHLAPDVATRKWNRAGAFTKENPSPTPSAGLNTSTTKSRYM
jgi:hypothetical protein